MRLAMISKNCTGTWGNFTSRFSSTCQRMISRPTLDISSLPYLLMVIMITEWQIRSICLGFKTLVRVSSFNLKFETKPQCSFSSN